MKVRSSLQKVDGLSDVVLQLEPPTAHFRIDPAKTSMQDLVRAVRAAGSIYDARLIVKTDGPGDKVRQAFGAVKGVRSPGFPDRSGIWLITFVMDEKTFYPDLEAAASTAGSKLSDSGLKK